MTLDRTAARVVLNAARTDSTVPRSLIDQALQASGDLVGGKGGDARVPARAFGVRTSRFVVVDPVYGLTDREVDVLAAFAPGRTYEQVGLVMDFSPHTVQDHVKDIYRKMGTNHMTTAVLRAERAGLLREVAA